MGDMIFIIGGVAFEVIERDLPPGILLQAINSKTGKVEASIRNDGKVLISGKPEINLVEGDGDGEQGAIAGEDRTARSGEEGAGAGAFRGRGDLEGDQASEGEDEEGQVGDGERRLIR